MTNPKVSIVIPNYNKEKYITETLNSVINQSYNNWECIIVDDRSTDNSYSIILNIAQGEPRIKPYLRQEEKPGGGSVCRNIALKIASGEYIVFLDSDDLILSTCIEKRSRELFGNDKLDFAVFPIGTFFRQIGDSSSIWRPKGGNYLEKFLAHDLPWHTTSVIWKKSFLDQIGGFDPEYLRLQDVELHTRALIQEKVNFKILYNQAPDCYYRIDEGRIVSDKLEFLTKWVAGAIMYIEKTDYLLQRRNISNKFKNKLKGTVISTLSTLLYRRNIMDIQEKDYEKLRDDLLLSSGVKKIINKKDSFILKSYEKGYKLRFNKFKGYNYFCKKIISF